MIIACDDVQLNCIKHETEACECPIILLSYICLHFLTSCANTTKCTFFKWAPIAFPRIVIWWSTRQGASLVHKHCVCVRASDTDSPRVAVSSCVLLRQT